MALFAGDRHYCKIVWMENGRIVVRRVYELTIQQPSGLVQRLTGKDLPDGIVIQTGPSMKGRPTMEVMMFPESRMAEGEFSRFPIEQPWPRRRDIMHMGGAFFLLGLIRLFLMAAQASQ